MTKRTHILLNLLTLVLMGFLGYAGFARQEYATFLEMLLTPWTLMPVVFIPWTLVHLWKFWTAERAENVLDPNFAFAARQPLLVRVGSGLLGLGVFAVGALRLWRGDLLPGDPGSIPMNLTLVVVGGLGALSALTSPLMRLKLSPDGLEYSMIRPAHISWHDVAEVKLRSIFLTTWVELTLKDATGYRAAGPLARWKKMNKVQILPMVFGLGPDVLYRGIEARRNVFTF